MNNTSKFQFDLGMKSIPTEKFTKIKDKNEFTLNI